jgi:hypothetical protein
MVVHAHEEVDAHPIFIGGITQSGDKTFPIRVVAEEPAVFHATDRDVIDRTLEQHTQFPRRGGHDYTPGGKETQTEYQHSRVDTEE